MGRVGELGVVGCVVVNVFFPFVFFFGMSVCILSVDILGAVRVFISGSRL